MNNDRRYALANPTERPHDPQNRNPRKPLNMLDTFAPTREAALARVNGVRPGDHARSRNSLEGGVEALVRSAAATYAGQSLRISAVAPGMTDTPMTAGMLKMPAMREGAARLPGQTIPVDGGCTTVRPLVK